MHFLHYGCKVNQYETNAMLQSFKEANYEIVDFKEKADIYVINTCSVTNMSERKSRQIIHKAKKQNNNAILVVVGCYAQVAKKELEKIEYIDLVLGVNEKNRIREIIEEYIKTNVKESFISSVLEQKEYLDFGNITYTEKTRSVIKIQDGCDRYCSYCIIPYTRGRVRSRSIISIENEVKEVCKKGINEIVLTGIHIASYGKDFKDNIQLIDLLDTLNKIDEVKRIRLGSLEPTLINEQFVSNLSKFDKVCHHFHLSLQSGSNETLKRMNRRYTKEEFKSSVSLLNNSFKDAIFTTDIIVGFPGETDEEFLDTYKFLKEINFFKMHIFKYSKRNGTKAAIMENQVEEEIKEKRSKILIELSKQQQLEILKQYINKELEILIEQKDGNYYKGHCKNFIEVRIPIQKENLENKIIKVKTNKIEKENLYAENIM